MSKNHFNIFQNQRSAVENPFRHLVCYEEVCSKINFKGISQIWGDTPAWYFWSHNISGAYMLYFSQYIESGDYLYLNYTLYYYPKNSSKYFGKLLPEELVFINDRAKFDAATSTPNFDFLEESLYLFQLGEIGIMVDSSMDILMLLKSENNRYGDSVVSDIFFDMINSVYSFYQKRAAVNILKLIYEDSESDVVVYKVDGFETFKKIFNIPESSLQIVDDTNCIHKWHELAHYQTENGAALSCCLHH